MFGRRSRLAGPGSTSLTGWLLCAAAAAFIAVASGGAAAAPIAISNGAFSGTTVRDCSGVGKCIEGDNLSFTYTVVEDLYAFNPGHATASTSATSSLGITGQGTSGSSVAVFDAATQSPIARQGAFAAANARVSGRTYSVSGFNWDGTGPPNRRIDLSLTYSGTDLVDGTQPFPATGPFSALVVYAEVFSLSTPTFVVSDLAPNVLGDPNLCRFDFGLASCLPGAQLDGFIQLGSAPNQTLVTGQLDFTLQAGQYYFLELFTGAWAKDGAYIDATHTISTSFANATGLTPLPLGVQSVPEPGTLALLCIGFVVLAATRRPRTARARASPLER